MWNISHVLSRLRVGLLVVSPNADDAALYRRSKLSGCCHPWPPLASPPIDRELVLV